jgi:gentisate 1,2-dioxygenase
VERLFGLDAIDEPDLGAGEIGDLMPTSPRPAALGHVWRWARLVELARRSGELVPVGRGGERRAIALANSGLGGAPFATPTLWAVSPLRG